MTSDLRLILKCALIVLLFAWLLVRYARICLCDSCKEPFAIRIRGELQLCRDCARVYDRNMRPRHRAILFLSRLVRRRTA